MTGSLMLAGWLLGVARADTKVVVEARKAGRPTVVVRAPAGPAFLPGCRGVVWERFDADTRTFVPIVEAACAAAAPAVPIDAEGREFSAEVDLSGVQVVRALVVVGTGCRSGQPFLAAGCTEITSVAGPTINVRAALAEDDD